MDKDVNDLKFRKIEKICDRPNRKCLSGRTSLARIGRMGEETKHLENPCDENGHAALPLKDGDEGIVIFSLPANFICE